MSSVGVVMDPNGIAVATVASDQSQPSVASNGTDYLVAWQDSRNGTNEDLYASRVTSAGGIAVANGFAISKAEGAQLAPSVASNGTDYLVAWTESRGGAKADIHASPVTASGVLWGPNPLPVSIEPGPETSPQVVYNPTEGNYLAVYSSSNRVRARFISFEGCGNSFLDPGETCDDGGVINGDGCNAWCGVEVGHACYSSGSHRQDINECEIDNGGCAQTCVNAPGTFSCACLTGFTLDADAYSCRDIDECATNNGGCAQTCTNTSGSYQCSCDEGYRISVDAESCSDVDECATNNGGCAQTCTNAEGSYSCSCSEGYTLALDELSCELVDECEAGMCDENEAGCGCRSADPGQPWLLVVAVTLLLRGPRRRRSPPSAGEAY